MQEILTVPEAAEVLGICRGSAYAAVKRGEVPSVRLGKRLLLPRVVPRQVLEDADIIHERRI